MRSIALRAGTLRPHLLFAGLVPACLLMFSVGLAQAPVPPWGNLRLDEGIGSGKPQLDQVTVSPDGSRVVYRTNAESLDERELFSVPSGGGVPVNLSRHPDRRFSVDGFLIAPNSAVVFYHGRFPDDDLHRAFAVAIDGEGRVALPPEVTERAADNVYTISPDSQYLVWRSDRETFFHHDLWRAPLDGGPVTKLADASALEESIESFRITPDGNHVVFARLQNSRYVLSSVPMEGGPMVLLGNPEAAGLRDPPRFRISDDSSEVALQSGSGMMVSAIDGSTSETLQSVPARMLDAQFLDDGNTVLFLTYAMIPGYYGVPPHTYIWTVAAVPRASPGDAVSLVNYVRHNADSLTSEETPLQVTPDERHFFYVFQDRLRRVTIDGTEPEVVFNGITVFSSTGRLFMLNDGALFIRATNWLHYLPSGETEPIFVDQVGSIRELELIDNASALAFLQSDSTAGVVTWEEGALQVQVLLSGDPVIDAIVPSRSTPLFVAQTDRASEAVELLSANHATGDVRSLTGKLEELDLATTSYAVTSRWSGLVAENREGLWLAARVGGRLSHVGSGAVYTISPNERYVAFGEVLRINLPLDFPSYILTAATAPFSRAHEPVTLYTQRVPLFIQPTAEFAFTFGEDSRTISFPGFSDEVITVEVTDDGYPVSSKTTGIPAFRGTVRQEEIIASKVSADGSAEARLIRSGGGPAELYVRTLPDGESFKVSGPLHPGYEVQEDFEISPNGRAVIYRANQGTGAVHLWMSRAAIDGNAWVLE